MAVKPSLKYAIWLKPEDAIKYFQSKGYTISWDWHDTWQEAHTKAFTVAKAMRLDILKDIRGMVQKSLDDGITFQQFKKELEPKLRAKGWWGKKLVGDGEGGKVVQLGSTRRLATIYQTNLQTAYMTGRYKAFMENIEDRPYFQYVAILDAKTRPAHRMLNGKVFRYDDPFWKAFWPPNGWNCRCDVRALSADDLKNKNLEISQGEGNLHSEEQLVSIKTGRKEPITVYTDPKTKREVATDVGWNYNPGREFWQPDWSKYSPEMKPLVNETKKEIAETIAASKIPGLKRIPDSQLGSNPGGIYEDASGTRYYVKFYKNELQAKTEYAAARIHQLMGLETPDIQLLRIADPKGKERLAVVNKWIDGLKKLTPQEMVAYKEDLSRIFQSSVLVKNWDVVGLEYDNIMLTKEGRLIVVDTGGSFKFRAQGATKPFEKMPAEVKTLLDPSINPQAAKVFGELFKSDVFVEAEGAKPLLSLKKTALSKVVGDAGFSAGEVKELSETLWQRREYLVDRYNLKGTYSPTGFGKYMEDFKKWGTSSWTPKIANGMINGSTDTAFQAEITSLVKKFEDYMNSKIHRYSRGVARALFREWSQSSSTVGAATIKLWAEERFGYIARYHSGITNRETIRSTLESHARESLSRARLDAKTVYKILDAEYEFHQYYLRRLHGYDEFKALRYVSNTEFNGSFENNLWQGNAVQSVTVKRGGFSGSRQVELEHRIENVIKAYYQGEKYMHYGAGESEYIVLGKKVPAKVIR